MNLEQAKSQIRFQVVDIVQRLGEDASDLRDDEVLPASGLIDSAGLLELIAWYEAHFAIELAQAEINIDNLGTIDAMARYALAKRGIA